ncbi:hypothetical protein CYMTET_8852 [Cymbomonas tetramitiformis]|uniref:beta-galactoside alpha-(2,6)-sialyltransferase n=1 Tax=Cymbomonas tetramitiformis TaxID=36881 RepID=A0AAE0GU32_9CHLO|nr:hypothetical protein CYMTET_8852 [Cymbomonas tetramitiformis]
MDDSKILNLKPPQDQHDSEDMASEESDDQSHVLSNISQDTEDMASEESDDQAHVLSNMSQDAESPLAKLTEQVQYTPNSHVDQAPEEPHEATAAAKTSGSKPQTSGTVAHRGPVSNKAPAVGALQAGANIVGGKSLRTGSSKTVQPPSPALVRAGPARRNGTGTATRSGVMQSLANETSHCAVVFSGPDCAEEFPQSEYPRCGERVWPGTWWTLSAANYMHSGFSLPAGFSRGMLPSTSPLQKEYPFSSCALVASSADLLKGEYGAEIDEHEVVMRINGAPTVGLEHHVGNKTTLRYSNGDFFGWRESDDEVHIGKWNGKSDELARLLRKRIHPINPHFLRFTRNAYLAGKGHLPTQGFRAMLLLIHLCRQVDIYGFQGGGGHYYDHVESLTSKHRRKFGWGGALPKWVTSAPVPSQRVGQQRCVHEIRKKRNTVIAAFYKWENTCVGNEELGNLLLNICTNKWQLLGGEEYDSTHFFGTLATRHQGNFLRAVIKVTPPFLSLLSYTNSCLNNLENKRIHILTLFSTQNYPEIFNLVEKENQTTLDLSRSNQFTLRILEASKGQVSDSCLLQLGEALLAYDLYTQTLEETADELARKHFRPENSAASLGLSALNLSTIPEEQEIQQEERETEREIDNDSESEREHESESDFKLDQNEDEGEVNFTAEGLQSHEESGDFDFGTISEATKFVEASKDVYENESDEEAEDLANENFLASVKIHRMTTKKTGEFTAREIEQARKQIRTHLLRHHLDIAVLSVTGKKYRNQLKPFIHVKVASQTEAASLVKLAVLDIDDVGYSITPKSHRCSAFICKDCVGRAALNHCSRNCPAKFRKQAMSKKDRTTYSAAAENIKTSAARASGAAKPAAPASASGNSAPQKKTHNDYRYGGHPRGCTCSACRITGITGKKKRTAEPSSSSPARKQHEGQSRRREIAEAASEQPIAQANQFEQLPTADETMGHD